MTGVETTIAGERVRLLAERALFWPGESTVFVANVQLGKAATFRHYGISVPVGTTAENLARLSEVLTKTGAERLIILGDLFHARARQTESMKEAIATWRSEWPEVAVGLVSGNHDKRSNLSFAQNHITLVGDRLLLPPFVGQHFPEASEAGHVLAGHLHPTVKLSRTGQRSLTLPCFYVTPSVTILPAFGAFTGSVTITPQPGERVFVIAGTDVVEASG